MALRSLERQLIKRSTGAASTLHLLCGPVELLWHRPRVRTAIERFHPDVVHALRFPFEGMMAALATPTTIPLIISVWGNDFTLQAPRNPIIGHRTRQATGRADGLMADCRRDVRLAREWGFSENRPAAVLPGAGGVRTDVFYPGPVRTDVGSRYAIPDDARVVINPRGVRGYVRNDAFFAAIPSVAARHPTALFVCVGMAGNPQIEAQVRKLGIADQVRLLPTVPHDEMADLFRRGDIAISPSEHDGTPNTLLEAMACGCFPVAGDIESIREWIVAGENGLLFDPTDPTAIAGALTDALERPVLRATASTANLLLIADRARHDAVMQRAVAFYHQVVSSFIAPAAITSSV